MKLIMDWIFIYYWLEWIWEEAEQQGDNGTILDDTGWGQYVIIDEI
tara:strand:- start:176 stop:313 length:138 start_codon:yes stop_codon:yes gene_type:complete